MTFISQTEKEMIAEGIEPNYWRASTDNDKKNPWMQNGKQQMRNVQIDEASVNKENKVVYVSVARH